MRILLYGNGGSGNHGCEAIVRGTTALLGEEQSYTIYSTAVEEDQTYGLGDLAEIIPARRSPSRDLRFLRAYLDMKLKKDYLEMDGLAYWPGILRARGQIDMALSVGGDNYCYDGTEIYGWLNRAYRKAGIPTVLWGCSVEPASIQGELAKDLGHYCMVAARESITYTAVKEVQEHAILSPDPAFFMAGQSCELDRRLMEGTVIGVNASPHILKCETEQGAAYENYKRLIQYILKETDAAVALIPHVVWGSNDDRTVLRQLWEDLGRDPRLVLVEDHTAPELKYIISRCSFFVGARTHATIAAYSTGVPTLAVGYSVKARGIARDLFGTEEGYVLPVQGLSQPDQLTSAFRPLYDKRETIHRQLQERLPDYLVPATAAVKMLKGLVER